MTDKQIDTINGQLEQEGPPTNAHGEPINTGDPMDNQEQR
jgi:hypothetical protein